MAPLPSRALAQPSFTPAQDQTTVRHLRLTVLRVTPLPHNGQRLQVRCGEMGFDLSIPDSPGFKPGDELVMEHPKDDNPLATPPSAIYFASPIPQKEKTMSAISANAIVTMTSLELVDYINSSRREQAEAAGVPFPSKGFAKLEHADFMKKVPEVLGGGAGNFSDTYIHEQNGQRYPCYRFPKREACLMAMSYSYELQAKVFDRMTALEDQQRAIPPQQKARAARLPNAMRAQVSALLMIGKALAKVKGVNEALATACTLDAIEVTTGLPTTLMARALPSVAPEDTATLNATQLGEPLGLSGRATNAILEKLGLQYRDEAKNWKLTEAGTAYGEMKPFHRNGHSGYETRWKQAVAEVLQKHLNSERRAA